jgi:hypothetical protein
LFWSSVTCSAFTEDEDRFLIVAMANYGFGQWDEIKRDIRLAWQFRFGQFVRRDRPPCFIQFTVCLI